MTDIPSVCNGCIYRGEEMTSDNLVCQNPYVSGPDEENECDEWCDDECGQSHKVKVK